MADIITLANNVTITKGQGNQVYQNLLEGMPDVSAYDALDLQIALMTANFQGQNDHLKFAVLTSMSQSKTDDGSWAELAITGPVTSAPSWTTLSGPPMTGGLLRYLRWRVDFVGGVNTCVFSITGMARRKSL